MDSIAKSVVIKLLKRRISFNALQKQYCFPLRKSLKIFQLKDLENESYLVKFQAIEDYTIVCFLESLWMVIFKRDVLRL